MVVAKYQVLKSKKKESSDTLHTYTYQENHQESGNAFCEMFLKSLSA